MNIELFKVVGEHCSNRENTPQKKGGEEIRHLIEQNWEKEKKINISFQNVITATPSFLDEAIGKLIDEYSFKEIQDKLSFEEFNEDTKARINTCIKLRLDKKAGNYSRPIAAQ